MNKDSSNQQGGLSAVDSLVQLSFLVQSILNRACADHDLSVIQLRLLGILRDREPAMLELARYLTLDKSSITGLVDRAERRGLVERTVSLSDRRGFNVKLTAAGRELADQAGQEIGRQIGTLLGTLDMAEQAQLTALASAILDSSASSS